MVKHTINYHDNTYEIKDEKNMNKFEKNFFLNTNRLKEW